MWTQFILQNLHFAINIFAALVFFGVGWLYLDAWTQKRRMIEGVRIVSFVLLSLSFLIWSIHIEGTLLTTSVLPAVAFTFVYALLRLLGFIGLITSLLI